MPITITEKPLYNLISLETSAWTTPFTWVDRINDVVGSIAYSQGGRVGPPGQSQTDVGTLTQLSKTWLLRLLSATLSVCAALGRQNMLS